MRALLVLAVVAVSPAPASAQMVLTVTGVTNRTDNYELAALDITQSPINAAECANASTTIDLLITGIDNTRTVLDFWNGNDCNVSDNRNTATSSLCELLSPSVSTAISGVTQWTGSIPVGELVDCSSTTDTTESIWILAVDNAGGTDDVTGAGQSIGISIGYDPAPPNAPTDLTAGSGEGSLTVRWTSDEQRVASHEVFVDPAGCADGVTPSSALLTAGGSPDASLTPISTGTTSAVIGLDAAGIPLGSSGAVAVRTVDLAGNVGPLSSIACLSHVQTMSWWDMYCPTPDAAPGCSGGCSVSLPGSGGASGAAWVLALLALPLARRRR